MSVDRRVKPSRRIKEKQIRRRKSIVIGGVAVVVVASSALGLSAIAPNIGIGDTSMPGYNIDVKREAIRAVAESNVDYTGHWYRNTVCGFEVYLPGDDLVVEEDIKACILYADESSNSLFGVTLGDSELPALNDDNTGYTKSIMDSLVSDIVNDVELVFDGYEFYPYYNLSDFVMNDGSKAIRVEGEMYTEMSREDFVSQRNMKFHLYGFITLRNDCTVFVWSVVNSDDSYMSSNVKDSIEDCSTIFFDMTE